MSYKLNTCRNEYEKDPKIKDEDIQEMKIWIQEISNMPDVTEYMLIQIYHVCDYNLEKAKKLTKKFYTFKATAEELFTGLDRKSENEYSFWDTNYSILLPSTTAEGYRVYYAGLKNYNSSKYNFEISITTAIKVITAIILEKGICPGYLIIFDMEGFGIGHLFSMKLPFIKKFFCFLEEAIPLKVKGIHIINKHAITDKMLMLVKPFMSKKTFDMFHFHSSTDDLHKVMSKEILPKDLGGMLPITREQLTEETFAKVTALEDEINKELQRRVNEVPCNEKEETYFWDIRRFF